MVFRDRVSLGSCLGTHSVDQAGLKLRNLPASASQELGLNHQSKKTHGGTRDSSRICSRGRPSRSSMGGEDIGPVKALCPSIGECHGPKGSVGGLVSRGSRERIGGFGGETRKGDNI